MASFDYRSTSDQWRERFPDWCYGHWAWVEQPPIAEWTGPTIFDWFPAESGTVPPISKRIECPRLFVSHKKDDEALALRICWLAHDAKWDYWLDVLEPSLAGLQQPQDQDEKTAGMSQRDCDLATAAIVEMALLNSSHLIVVMSGRTYASMWVPYEYGRVKEEAPLTNRAAFWTNPHDPPKKKPEYLLLGRECDGEKAIREWLDDELLKWRRLTKACRPGVAREKWEGAEPAPLPSNR